ncbi:polysaccharide pyruvyl transferase family protein [Stutzerimonas stutzeri]|uniref:Ketal pyruvate transferase PssM n=1 Tax=Stutzerimonas stutzeri (strain A1501) TaxID=379731 RepID=A4VR55_STUS1|nr:polysaccharide pyruvyl transferase family protein [Stutzerimonas stutzeri]ABP81456.1 putative ketal pyruvate transferase PssM [Stutzerimonas stutzeri A1501]RRW29271.1 polysaccharide pyruvyl transferase family protein [Stutzerimonas stutzeri]RSH67050.1 polysaccharide pyruvyl transferase family protein [Stutzerimonas stutzeri]TFZ23915.1 polysaccharide pyruvyl transferase family protein [Stutzerimonas stutzeri]UWG60202.1 polysaccharide pyruvyl transferase family protein [Stutzerimonas stutzeri
MTIKLYWCRGKGRNDPGQRNFGDYLSPLLVEMLAGKPVVYAPIDRAEMMAIGSILPRERKAKRFFLPHRLHIWGTGTDAPGLCFSPRHHYHALRGVKSCEQVAGLRNRPALGDPGLLASQWWSGRSKPTKAHKVGIIPHYVDRTHPAVIDAAKLAGVLLIDVFWPVEEVLRSIQSCDFILSSSMHGLIVADAFEIPNRRLRLSNGLISDFKFVDYYSAFDLAEPEPLSASAFACLGREDVAELIGEYKRPGLFDLQAGLLRSFPHF